MLADAADESLALTRFLDSEDTDPAELSLEVSAYVARIFSLFNGRQCLTLTGYTSMMLKLLSTPIVYNTQHGF
eukprot:3845772-Alexandrium_andersonii.AAC.1